MQLRGFCAFFEINGLEIENFINTVLREECGFRGMALADFRNNGHGFTECRCSLNG